MMKVTLISASSGKHVLRRDFALSLFVSDKLRYKKKDSRTHWIHYIFFISIFPWITRKSFSFFLLKMQNVHCSQFAKSLFSFCRSKNSRSIKFQDDFPLEFGLLSISVFVISKTPKNCLHDFLLLNRCTNECKLKIFNVRSAHIILILNFWM